MYMLSGKVIWSCGSSAGRSQATFEAYQPQIPTSKQKTKLTRPENVHLLWRTILGTAKRHKNHQ